MSYTIYNSIAEYFKSTRCPVLREVSYISSTDSASTEFYYKIHSIRCFLDSSSVTLQLVTGIEIGIENAILKIDNNRNFWYPLGIAEWEISNDTIVSSMFEIRVNYATTNGYQEKIVTAELKNHDLLTIEKIGQERIEQENKNVI